MISNKCRYALKAMLELAVRTGERPVTIGEIARSRHIPVRFLEAILRQLKQAGYADSVRGKDGGYFLGKPARQIRVGEIIRLFEGPSFASDGGRHHDRKKRPASHTDVFSDLWAQADEALAKVYDAVTFADLAEKERHKALDGVATYSI